MQAAVGSSQKAASLSKEAGGTVAGSPLSPEEWAARMPAQLVSACSRQPSREDTDTWLAFLLKPKWNTAALLNGTTTTKSTDRLQIPAEYVVWLDDYLQFENVKPASKRIKVCLPAPLPFPVFVYYSCCTPAPKLIVGPCFSVASQWAQQKNI